MILRHRKSGKVATVTKRKIINGNSCVLVKSVKMNVPIWGLRKNYKVIDPK